MSDTSPLTAVEQLSGRDLDAAIAEEILGWTSTKVGPDAHGENACEVLTPRGKIDHDHDLPRLGKLHRAWFVPQYHKETRLACKLAIGVMKGFTLDQNTPEPWAAWLCRKALQHHRDTRRR